MQVYYFTRTGKSKQIASQINNHTIYEISDHIDWSGKLNYIKAGALAAKKETLVADYQPMDSDSIILVFPLWAGTFPPVIRDFINNNKDKEITAVIVSAISSLSATESKIFKKVYEVKGKNNNAPIELL